jgi:hypothetical protein
MNEFKLLLATVFIFLPFAAMAQAAPNCSDTLGPVCPSGYQPIPGSCMQHPGAGCKAACIRTEWAKDNCNMGEINNAAFDLGGIGPENGVDPKTCEPPSLFKLGECKSKCSTKVECPTECPTGKILISCPPASPNCYQSKCGCYDIATGEWGKGARDCQAAN